MEIISNGNPIKLNSKKENPRVPSSARVLLTIILGGVPVKVSSPPMLEANARGIRSFEGIVFAFQAAETVIGIKAATVPVLLTSPDKKLEPDVIITSNFLKLLPARETNFFPANAVQPVLERPSPIMNKAAIIITVGLLKPLKVSVKSRIPAKKSASIDISATTSGGYFPHINKTIVIPRMIKSVYMDLYFIDFPFITISMGPG